jgi:hypothetical protein
MSKFSTSYDELRARIAATLTSHTELNNPYFIEDEADIMFDEGWTVGLGDSVNTGREICDKITFGREFIITMTKRYYAPARDIAARIAAEKDIFNDQITLLGELVAYSTDSIVKIDYVSDSGINFLAGDRFGILQLDTTITLEYFEDY